MPWLALLLLFAPLAPRPSDHEPDAARLARLTAHQVLQVSEAIYSNCRSYRDSGRLEERLTHGPPSADPLRRAMDEYFSGTWMTFRTAFARPDRLRFEYTETSASFPDGDQRYIVAWERGLAREWTTWGGVEP